MGFSLNPLKAITRAVGIHDSSRPAINTALKVLFPVYGLNSIAYPSLEKLAGNLLSPKPQTRSQSTQPFYQQPYNLQFQAPSYQAPIYGGGGGGLDPWSYTQPYQQPYGGNPWGYSMVSPSYSTVPYQASSAQPDRSWEDLVGLATTVLPFFL